MSHRKRVRAYWNKRLAAERAAKLWAEINAFWKQSYDGANVRAKMLPDYNTLKRLALFKL